MPSIMKPNQVDIDSLVYSEPKINSLGGQTVFVNMPDRNKLRINTPKCKLPFGISEYNSKFSLQLSLQGLSEQMQDFKTFISKLDEKNIEMGSKYSTKWFKKNLVKDTVKELYNPILKQTNPNYPPNIKVKLPFRDDTFLGEVFDLNRNIISLNDITKGCYVEAIIELSGVYFVAKEFGISWKVIQLKIYPSENIKGYAFIEDESDNSDVEP